MRELTDLRMGGVTPFVSYGDVINDSLRQSRAILLMLEHGYRAETELQRIPQGEEIEVFRTLNPAIIADAIEGVEALLALAQYCRDAESEQRRPQPARAVAA